MDIHEELDTTRMMRRLRPDPVPPDVQARILEASVRAPNGGNTQRGAEVPRPLWSRQTETAGPAAVG
jgi:Nitroreductase family